MKKSNLLKSKAEVRYCQTLSSISRNKLIDFWHWVMMNDLFDFYFWSHFTSKKSQNNEGKNVGRFCQQPTLTQTDFLLESSCSHDERTKCADASESISVPRTFSFNRDSRCQLPLAKQNKHNLCRCSSLSKITKIFYWIHTVCKSKSWVDIAPVMSTKKVLESINFCNNYSDDFLCTLTLNIYICFYIACYLLPRDISYYLLKYTIRIFFNFLITKID
jgi:hypothetical protein